jgi:hypothetical protein
VLFPFRGSDTQAVFEHIPTGLCNEAAAARFSAPLPRVRAPHSASVKTLASRTSPFPITAVLSADMPRPIPGSAATGDHSRKCITSQSAGRSLKALADISPLAPSRKMDWGWADGKNSRVGRCACGFVAQRARPGQSSRPGEPADRRPLTPGRTFVSIPLRAKNGGTPSRTSPIPASPADLAGCRQSRRGGIGPSLQRQMAHVPGGRLMSPLRGWAVRPLNSWD